ncbi:hypothetical protein D3C80_1129270 [compost metagenome]
MPLPSGTSANTTGTAACRRGLEFEGRVEAGGQDPLKVVRRLGALHAGRRLQRTGLPAAVAAQADHLTIGQLQHHLATETGDHLLALQQALTFKYLTPETLCRDGEDLTDKIFDDGGDGAHETTPVARGALNP